MTTQAATLGRAVSGLPPAQLLIDGKWRDAEAGGIPVINPSDGEAFAQIARGQQRDVDAAVKAARAAIEGAWGRMSALERGRLLMKLGRAVPERTRTSWRGSRRATPASRSSRRKADIVALARYFEYLRRRRRQGAWRDHPLSSTATR